MNGLMNNVIRRVPWHEKVTVRGLSHRLTWWGERSAQSSGAPARLDGLRRDLAIPRRRPAAGTGPAWRRTGAASAAPNGPPDGYWFADYFADLEALLDIVCPAEPAKLIAHSMGGNVASMYAGIRPKRVKWVANVEGVGLKRSSPEDAPARYAEWLDQVREPASGRRYSSVECRRELSDQPQSGDAA